MGRASQLVAGHGLLPVLRKRYEAASKRMIIRALAQFKGNKQAAADHLGINRTTLVMWCKAHAPELINKG